MDEIPREGVKNKSFIITPLNGEWMHGVVTDGRVILHDLEWRSERPYAVGLSEVWASNPEYARRINAKYVLLGSHPDLGHPGFQNPDMPKIYDACHLSYITPRRQAVYDEFVRLGGILAPNAWGKDRHDILAGSRCMLYVAQSEDFPALAPLRAAIAAAYKLPLIAEIGWNLGKLKSFIYECNYANLAFNSLDAVRLQMRIKHLPRLGNDLYEYLCIQNTFRVCVEEALNG